MGWGVRMITKEKSISIDSLQCWFWFGFEFLKFFEDPGGLSFHSRATYSWSHCPGISLKLSLQKPFTELLSLYFPIYKMDTVVPSSPWCSYKAKIKPAGGKSTFKRIGSNGELLFLPSK